MTDVSRAANLSKEYINHSCRATTVHVLDEAEFPSRHIMSITGHKSETTLKTYSGKPSENTKKRMSKVISEKTLGVPGVVCIFLRQICSTTDFCHKVSKFIVSK
jgi:hypothetical protein